MPAPFTPPSDWPSRIRDLAQVKNVLNGDTVVGSPEMPTAARLLDFFRQPGVLEAWLRFNDGRPRL